MDISSILGKRKKKVKIGKLINVTPGRRHAWFESSVGPVRKPVISKYDASKGKDVVTLK